VVIDGRVPNVTVKESSGDPSYGDSAMRAIAEAAPFPRLPDEFPGASLKVSMGFSFGGERDAADLAVPTEADAAESARRKAASASIAAGKLAMAEKQLVELQPWTCPGEPGVDALRSRLERAREAARAADERERERQATQMRRCFPSRAVARFIPGRSPRPFTTSYLGWT
jgi:TonB family protein